MYKNLIYPLLVVALLLGACTPFAATPPANDQPVQNEPNPTVGTNPEEQSFEPQPGDEKLGRAEVEIEKADLLTLESFPPQFRLNLSGWKGNPCNQLRVVVPEPDAQNQILVDVYTVFDPAAVCVQVLEGFELQIPLDNLEAGKYTVLVNGTQVGEIQVP